MKANSTSNYLSWQFHRRHDMKYQRLKQVRIIMCDTYKKVTVDVKNPKAAYKYNCPVEATLDVIGGKWKVLILFWLRDQVCRFGELRRKIPHISERMLTQQLRELENDGVVHRKIHPVVPPKVEYSLTIYGRTLGPITELMCKWGEKHQQRVLTTVASQSSSREGRQR